MNGWLVSFMAVGLAHTAANSSGFDPVRIVQEREARARRDAEKTKAAVLPAAERNDDKRAERLAALDRVIRDATKGGAPCKRK